MTGNSVAAILQPTVLESIDLLGFVRFVLGKHDLPSVLVVCASKEDFLGRLKSSTALSPPVSDDTKDDTSRNVIDLDDQIRQNEVLDRLKRTFHTLTLRLLASARTVKLVFCPEVRHLRAFLATLPYRSYFSADEKALTSTEVLPLGRILAILDMIQLHRSSLAYSAQGLNSTFAIAVEAAHKTGSRLVVAECAPPTATTGDTEETEHDLQQETHVAPINPWDEELSMLNVTTKSFGAGERGWVGRTVKARAIAARWCVFERLRDPDE